MKADTHPHKAGRKPSLLIADLAPPLNFVGSIQDFDDRRQPLNANSPLAMVTGIPYCLSTNDGISSDQLRDKIRMCSVHTSSYLTSPLSRSSTTYGKTHILVVKVGLMEMTLGEQALLDHKTILSTLH